MLDNLQPHTAVSVRQAFAAAGVEIRYLPPYSPDLNPIEPCWSKIKTLLRGQAARPLEALDRVLPEVIEAVSAQDARGWFAHAGDRSQ